MTSRALELETGRRLCFSHSQVLIYLQPIQFLSSPLSLVPATTISPFNNCGVTPTFFLASLDFRTHNCYEVGRNYLRYSQSHLKLQISPVSCLKTLQELLLVLRINKILRLQPLQRSVSCLLRLHSPRHLTWRTPPRCLHVPFLPPALSSLC